MCIRDRQIAVVVIVRETQILDIRSAAREGESPAEDELERRSSLMVEITVLSSGSGEGIDGFVVRADVYKRQPCRRCHLTTIPAFLWHVPSRLPHCLPS